MINILNFIKKYVFILLSFTWVTFMQSQVKLSTDFTSESDKRLPIHNVWNTANRISPRNGSNIRTGLKMNIVRMIGGINKVVNGVAQKDLDYDPCIYDSIKNKYVYRWDPLIDRLNKVVNSQTEILQIALDQPPWAFQHGYTFIQEGTRDNVNFRENERISVYGNSLPPANKDAYHDFIKALMTKLVETYGEEKVLSWRFRVGSEIETPDHWYGTKQDFIEHFANTESAVRSILPNAKVGLHTRNPGFLYKNGTILNYKGEPYASFIEGLIDYNHANNIKCDFWGLSDYIVIGNSNLRDMNGKYTKNFAPLINNPKWNPETSIDIMEYKTVTTMNGADGKGTIGCETTHREIVELIFANTFYKNKDKGLEHIYRWGNRTGSEDPDAIKELNKMIDLVRYETSISGNPNTSTNELDAIFAKKESESEFDVLIYNYNSSALSYRDNENVDVSFFTDLPVGTTLYCRSKPYGKENNKLQNFLINNSNHVMSGFDEKGAPDRTLTEEGYTAYQNYENPNPHQFTEWKSLTTKERNDGKSGSEVKMSTEIGSFAFEKFEFRLESAFVKAITPANYVWTSTEDFSAWFAVKGGMTINTDNDKLNVAFSSESSWPTIAINNLNLDASLYGTLRIVVKNNTDKPDLQMFPNASGASSKTGRKKETVPNDNQWHTLDFDLINWRLWTGTINEFEFYNNFSSGSIVFDSIEFIPKNPTTHTITLSKEGQGLLNYSSGTALNGQEFSLNAIANEGWKFEGWEGDIISTDNPLAITVTSDMNIKAVFSNDQLSVDKNNTQKFIVFPNPSDNGVFQLKSQTPQSWKVYAITGKKISEGKGRVIDISSFARGMYILKVNNSFIKLLY
ncbi:T9SS type A sorting domain-containing protein [Hyunsoonleella sp. SJ7]|uniref:T9SS type A sorting domain-containing protein n=1 Tax=Hyunsoonleella aquatilis TaxID=2762758 RepID=A0A923HC57_9FLAO|nr:T9SS type A sorting domain-containing protein [Hyunsoonleella aquatilis]MBC3758684.1 T9SS type A sorting domain-containing protein [Hyunsoonleella aquatilis]